MREKRRKKRHAYNDECQFSSFFFFTKKLILSLVLTLSLVAVHVALHAVVTVIGAKLRIFTLKGLEILTGLREFTLLHTFTHVPVDESTLGEHHIELLIHTAEDLADGSSVSFHANSTRKSRHVTAGDNHSRTAVKTSLETSGTPINKLNGALVLDLVDRFADILRNDITTIHKAASHVFTLTRITLNESVNGIEGSSGDLLNRVLLVRSTRLAHERSIGGCKEVDTRVRNQVNLELIDIHIERTLKAKRSSERRNDLRDQAVKVGIRRTRDVEILKANVVESLVIHEESAISMLKHSMSCKDSVVRLNDSTAELRRRPDDEIELALLAIVRAKTLKEKAGETRASTTTNAVEDEEALKTSAIVSELTDAIESNIDQILADGVMTTSKVVSSILATADELIRVMEAAVRTSANLIDNARLKIDEDGTRDELSTASFAEESAQGIVPMFFCHFLIDGTVRTDTVLKAEKLPGGVTSLDTSLANMDHNAFPHFVM